MEHEILIISHTTKKPECFQLSPQSFQPTVVICQTHSTSAYLKGQSICVSTSFENKFDVMQEGPSFFNSGLLAPTFIPRTGDPARDNHHLQNYPSPILRLNFTWQPYA